MAATKSGANWLMDLPSIHLSCQNKARRPLPTTTDVDASNIDPFMDLRGALRLGDERRPWFVRIIPQHRGVI
jgi:hypothetical protein